MKLWNYVGASFICSNTLSPRNISLSSLNFAFSFYHSFFSSLTNHKNQLSPIVSRFASILIDFHFFTWIWISCRTATEHIERHLQRSLQLKDWFSPAFFTCFRTIFFFFVFLHFCFSFLLRWGADKPSVPLPLFLIRQTTWNKYIQQNIRRLYRFPLYTFNLPKTGQKRTHTHTHT